MLLTNLLILGLLASAGKALQITVSPTGGNQTSHLQYGIMFEDINNSGDGGIYAELISNRAFQGSLPDFPANTTSWTAVGGCQLSLQTAAPLSAALPTYLHVHANSAKGAQVGIRNSGYWGIDVKPQTYRGSFYMRGSYIGNVVASLESALEEKVWGSTTIAVQSSASEWMQISYTINCTATAPNSNNTFSLTWQDGTDLDVNLISLFPPTFNNRPNGMRTDLMEALKGLNPKFLRMPGGNNLEGIHPPYLWKWNETIGPLKDRPGRPGTWSYENTDGLGLIEYLQWCEDLNMEPLLAVWSGLYLDGTIIPESELQPYVQDALDELEFIMGDTSTSYGALRTSLGYPSPWKINYVEVGNEDNLYNGQTSYNDYRFPMFYDAIKAKYPKMNVIASTVNITNRPGDSSGDYHQYTRPDMFVSQYDYFDNFSTVHKTLLGEYACVQPNNATDKEVDWTQGLAGLLPWPEWIGTVSEAVYLIGAERNADKIIGASYAPLLQNLNRFQWSPDLISFTANPNQTVLSTSYHQIKLFSNTLMTTVLPTAADAGPGPAYWVAGENCDTKEYIMKAAVYNSTQPVPFKVNFPCQEGKKATLTVLTAPEPTSMNVLGGENQVITTVSEVAAQAGCYEFELPNWSVAVLVNPM